MKINGSILLTILIILLGYQIAGYSMSQYHGTAEKKLKIWMPFKMKEELKVGDQIELNTPFSTISDSREGSAVNIHRGIVIDFIKGKDVRKAAVVKLDHFIAGDSVSGNYLLLKLKYDKQTWQTTGPVSIKLCDSNPLDSSFNERGKSDQVETTASFRIKIRDFSANGNPIQEFFL